MVTQDFKIVCIVQNIQGRSSQGLSHTFDKQNNDFINSFLYTFNNDELTTAFGYNENKPKYLLISEDNVKSKNQLETSDKWEILFVCDSISLGSYPWDIFDENTLVMFHTTPNIANQEIITTINGIGIKKGKKGQHEPYENQGYQRLLKLTEAWENGSFDKEKYVNAKQYIIDWFGINDELEAKLELLHNCLVPESIPQTLDSLLSSYDGEFKDFKNEITNKNEIIDKSAFDKEYIDALAKFRNALLDF